MTELDAIPDDTPTHIASVGREADHTRSVPRRTGHKAERIKVGGVLIEAVLNERRSKGTTAGICGETRTRHIFDLDDHVNLCRDAP